MLGVWGKSSADKGTRQRFIKKLRKARFEAGLKQLDVVKKFRHPQSYISRVESGEYRLDILEVKRFAKIYGKSIEYFVK